MSLSISKKISAEYLMKESHDHQQPKSAEILLYFITKQGIETHLDREQKDSHYKIIIQVEEKIHDECVHMLNKHSGKRSMR